MRIPLGKHTLVTMTVVGMLLTGVLAVGLMNPTLIPGIEDLSSEATAPQPAASAASERPSTPSVVTVVVTPDQFSIGAAVARQSTSQPSQGTQADFSASSSDQVQTRGLPTPNPNFTPAVRQKPADYDDDEYEEDDHDEDDDHDDYDDHEEDERDDDDDDGDDH